MKNFKEQLIWMKNEENERQCKISKEIINEIFYLYMTAYTRSDIRALSSLPSPKAFLRFTRPSVKESKER